MAAIRTRLVLTGARTGHTVFLGGFQFTRGVYVVEGDEVTVPKVSRYLGRAYKAFPEGSEELRQAQEADASNPLITMGNGVARTPTRAQLRRLKKEQEAERISVVREVAYGAGNAAMAARTGETAGAAAPGGIQPGGGGPAQVPSDVSGGAGNTSAGTAGGVSGGDGRSDSGDGRPQTDADRILTALKGLDPANDEHWTSEKQPKVDVVAQLSGLPSVTRAQINEVAAEFRRPA